MRISIKEEGVPFEPFWKFCVGAGRANEGLRASWLEHLELVKRECGFKYCRFHGLFHDDMFVCNQNADGGYSYNWQYVDDLFDRMLKIGVKPFVELGFCPGPMASNDSTIFWWKGHICPPKDYGDWADMIEKFVRHCVKRYGIDEVQTWFFEVWNEPNLKYFWSGTKSEYFELYRVTALAVKAVDGRLKVGGPATSNFVPDDRFAGEREDEAKHLTHTGKLEEMTWKGAWIEDFLKYASGNSLPVDFVSTHPYPTDWALDAVNQLTGRVRQQSALLEDCKWLSDIVKSSSYPNAQIHLTEWNSSPSPRDFSHDFVQEAAYVIKSNLDVIGLADSLSYWTFTDVFEESGAGGEYFHGGFGMINYQGIAKPAFHAYRFLNNLADRLIYKGDGLCITKDKSGQLSAVAFNYPEQMDAMTIGCSTNTRSIAVEDSQKGEPKKLHLQIESLKPNSKILVEIFDKNNGWGFDAWGKIGSPQEMTIEQTEYVRRQSFATQKTFVEVNSDGFLDLSLDLQPWAIVLIKQIC